LRKFTALFNILMIYFCR
ncbi:Undecaprenyl-phosphate alpha-N-acetylglucosaminyl 1-phosphate transferase, partial [Haemophilus influenzae]